MCGIAGRINLNSEPVKSGELESMRQALLHRGPDDRGVYADGPVGLTHSRLSIIDLSESAREPMSNEDGSVWAVFNGEIYNYLELKKALLGKGHRFKSNSDGEVLLHLYEEEGMGFLDKLNGMFAFSIYDKKRKKLILARDRIGIKPLYYYRDNEKFAFASEIKAILKCENIDKELDFTALSEYLSLGYISFGRTAFKRIKKLKPAEYLELNIPAKNFTIKKYWDFTPGDNKNEDEACEKITRLLSDSISLRLISDVPLGAFLSGGIDSSLIVAFMAKASSRKPKTFTIGFPDEPQFDETFYAKKVSEMYDTEHTEIKLKYEDILDCVPHILDSFDEPFADSSCLPTFIVSRATRKHVKVALSGDGGDELFGGYNKYIGMLMQKNPLFLPSVSGALLRTFFGRALEDFESTLFGSHKRRVKKMTTGMGRGDIHSHISWMTHFSECEKKKVVNFDLNNGAGGKEIFNAVGNYFTGSKADLINKSSYADSKISLVDDMLVKVDRMSMLASLEVRVPFLDHRLVSEVFSLSGSLKIRGNRRKYILLKAAKNLLPKELHTRSKKGFEVPIGPWFKKNKKLQQLFMDCMKSKGKEDLVNTDSAIRLFNLHKRGPVDYNRELWFLFVLKWWSDKYL
ncbi:MAG: asparagine synthase (glutamine-hydrolyzing) [Omnitrophica bacterium]|nr:asparagine synthase (glutamine-hydrolyzing) [Candidatus Omnitrophota bacterium]